MYIANRRSLFAGACVLSFALTITSCGGGSDESGTVLGLEIPEQMGLVDAASTGSLSLSDGVLGAVTFANDPVEFWVHDDSMEALETVNVILCSVEQTGYNHPSAINQGPYVALVGCEDRGGDQAGAGQEVTEFQRCVVDSSRASDSSPHIVEFWFDTNQPDGAGGETASIIYGKMTISAGASDTAPFGSFELYYKQLLATDAPSASDGFRGFLKTVARTDGQTEFVFYANGGDVDGALNPGDFASRRRARVVRSADGSSGRAYSENQFAFNPGSGVQRDGAEFFLQFNSNYLARKRVDGTSVTKVFDRNDFTTYVYNYGVYNADTDLKVEALSGFPVETSGGVHGWAGYHGLWIPEHASVENGDTLTRRTFGAEETTESYTAVIIPGRLHKNTRVASTLGNLTGEDLESFDPSSGTQIQVQWTGSDLVQTATRSDNSWLLLGTPVSVLSSYSAGQWVHFYSQARGTVEFEWPSSTPSDATEVFLLQHETITGASPELSGGPLTLYGYRGRLRSLLTENQANFQNAESPYFADATNVGEVKTYVFDGTTLMLTLDGAEVRVGDGVSVTAGPGASGFQCGPMFPAQFTSLGDESSQTVVYTWRTGDSPWNKLQTVKDSGGNFVQFDAPLPFSYTHDEIANTDYHGKTYRLEWTGSHLGGVPFRENTVDQRWRPGFNIPTGTIVTNANQNYKVKQLVGEQEMVEVMNPTAVITAQGFDLDVTLDAPTDEWTDPAIGAMPTVTSAPLFVEGVPQSSDG